MIITFCGHSKCKFSDDIKEQLKNILRSEIIKKGAVAKPKKFATVFFTIKRGF